MKYICILLIGLSFFAPCESSGQQLWPLHANEWAMVSPDAQGFSADTLLLTDQKILQGKYGYVDDVFITRNGQVIYQKKYHNDYRALYGANAKEISGLNPFINGPYNYFDPWWHPFYRGGDLHTLQSVTKSVVSVTIGIAVARQEFPDLSTPVLNYFDISKVQNVDDRKKKMTIRDLITMTGGFEWEEWIPFDDPKNDCAGMEASFDWIKYTIDKPMVAQPGERFKYSSGGSQLLAYIFKASTGKDIEEYASQYLFGPLGIKEWVWKRTPTGLPDTEGGLFLKASDLARIGYLFLRDGTWNGQRILTPEWIKDSVKPSASVSKSVKYGYKWWLIPYGNDRAKFVWACRGFGDQSMIIIPEYGIVAVFTAWNISQESQAHLATEATIKMVLNAITKK